MASTTLTGVALIAFAVYWAGLVLYRLFLQPLARFPGPRLAAVTPWYEAYYEIVLNGQYSKKISQLHDQYGPIIRVYVSSGYKFQIPGASKIRIFQALLVHLESNLDPSYLSILYII